MSAATWPAIDHSILSPSGRVSKRARAAALKREGERLFRGVEISPPTVQPSESVRLREHAARLLALASRGMSPKKYRKHAEAALVEAARLEAGL